MSYNGNNKRNFNNNRNNGNRNFNNRNNNRNNNQQYNKKQEIIAKQNANLDMIEAVAEYLDNDIANTDIILLMIKVLLRMILKLFLSSIIL